MVLLAERPELWLLSHLHKDHTVGISTFLQRQRRGRIRVLCTRETGVLLDVYFPGHGLGPKLCLLDLDTPASFELRGGGRVDITAIDARHCAGSAMFRVLYGGKRVLCTGDFRMETDPEGAFPSLFCSEPDRAGPEEFDAIRVDCTFLCAEDAAFPTREETMVSMWRHMAIALRDEKSIVMPCGMLGYEPLVEYIGARLKETGFGQIHVDDGHLTKLVAARPGLGQYLTLVGRGARVHACTLAQELVSEIGRASCRERV